MAFDTHYPNRKDKRKAYRKSKAFDRSCRNHGSCSYCENNRLNGSRRREPLLEVPAHTDRALTHKEMADALCKMTKPAVESVQLKYAIDESKVLGAAMDDKTLNREAETC